MDLNLKGKKAIISGANRGIGLTIAHHYAGEGIDVALLGRNNKALVEAAAEVRARHSAANVVTVLVDLEQPHTIKPAAESAVRQLGGVDILVNNAGIQHVAPVEEFPVAKWDAIIAINMSSAFHGTRMAVPYMKSKKWGRIINVASAHALVASPFKSAYVASKHGIMGFTKTIALEVAEYGITVNAICPGYVLTPLVEKQIPDTAKARGITEEQVKRDVLLAAQPTKQFVTTEQVAGTALFLCSDAAASITGTNISVEGGWTAH